MQSKVQSLLESLLNIFIGWLISVISSAIIFPMLGVDLPWEANLKASAIFTVISIVRTYFVRRYFNRLHVKQQQKKAETLGNNA